MGSVLRAISFRDDDKDCGEYRVCSQCRHMFWAEWDNSDKPNYECPYCGSLETEFLGFEAGIDKDVKRIFKLHPEDNPVLRNHVFTEYPEANTLETQP